jgi:hypothetical protein
MNKNKRKSIFNDDVLPVIRGGSGNSYLVVGAGLVGDGILPIQTGSSPPSGVTTTGNMVNGNLPEATGANTLQDSGIIVSQVVQTTGISTTGNLTNITTNNFIANSGIPSVNVVTASNPMTTNNIPYVSSGRVVADSGIAYTNIPQLSSANSFSSNQTISNSNPMLILNETSAGNLEFSMGSSTSGQTTNVQYYNQNATVMGIVATGTLTSGDVPQFSGTNGKIVDSTIASANLVTAASNITNGNLAQGNGTKGLSDSSIATSAVTTLTGSQTLTNKTLTSPVVNSPNLTWNSVTYSSSQSLASTQSGTLVILDPASASGAFTITLPALAAGLFFRFTLKSTSTTNAPSIQTNGSTTSIHASFNKNATLGSLNASHVLTFVANAQTVGDHAEFWCDGTSWTGYILGQASGSITAS